MQCSVFNLALYVGAVMLDSTYIALEAFQAT